VAAAVREQHRITLHTIPRRNQAAQLPRLVRRLLGRVRQIIDFEIDYQKAHGDASAEKCCEVKLPSPLNN